MAKISASELARLAELSGLTLDSSESATMISDLEKVLDYVEQLNQIDTEGVEPTYQVLDLQNVWRGDEIKPGVSPSELLGLQINEQVHREQIKVPKVL